MSKNYGNKKLYKIKNRVHSDDSDASKSNAAIDTVVGKKRVVVESPLFCPCKNFCSPKNNFTSRFSFLYLLFSLHPD